MSKQASFKVYTTDGLKWQIHVGYIAPDFVQATVIASNDKDDIGAGFSAELNGICGELADKIKAHMSLI